MVFYIALLLFFLSVLAFRRRFYLYVYTHSELLFCACLVGAPYVALLTDNYLDVLSARYSVYAREHVNQLPNHELNLASGSPAHSLTRPPPPSLHSPLSCVARAPTLSPFEPLFKPHHCPRRHFLFLKNIKGRKERGGGILVATTYALPFPLVAIASAGTEEEGLEVVCCHFPHFGM